MADERQWPRLTCERRYPGLPRIINPSTLHMDTERTTYVHMGELQAAEQQRDRLRAKAGEARVWLEEGEYGKAHAILEQIRDEEDIEAAQLQDREDDRA